MDYSVFAMLFIGLFLYWQSRRTVAHIKRLRKAIEKAEDVVKELHAIEDRSVRRGGMVGDDVFSFMQKDVQDAIDRMNGKVS